jgi:hypothetical protein
MRFISRSEVLLSSGTVPSVVKKVQFFPLVQDIVHRLRHRVLGQQLIAPTEGLAFVIRGFGFDSDFWFRIYC